ncbi:unnamed protein product, partial [Nesidiocoris tenuis]
PAIENPNVGPSSSQVALSRPKTEEKAKPLRELRPILPLQLQSVPCCSVHMVRRSRNAQRDERLLMNMLERCSKIINIDVPQSISDKSYIMIPSNNFRDPNNSGINRRIVS